MKLLIYILNQTEKLEALLCSLTEAKIPGATIIESTGMARALHKMENGPIVDSLRYLIDPEQEENHTLLMALKEEQVPIAKAAIRDVIGDLSKPNTGILFTLPIEDVEGIRF